MLDNINPSEFPEVKMYKALIESAKLYESLWSRAHTFIDANTGGIILNNSIKHSLKNVFDILIGASAIILGFGIPLTIEIYFYVFVMQHVSNLIAATIILGISMLIFGIAVALIFKLIDEFFATHDIVGKGW